MIRSFYILSIILTISSCHLNENDNSEPMEKEVEKTLCSLNFKLGGTDSAYHFVSHCSFTEKKSENELSFIYTIDSTTFFYEKPITKKYEPNNNVITYRLNKTHDTVYNVIKEDDYIQSYEFFFRDSLRTNLGKKPITLYIYDRILDEHTWDEVLYFSKEIGFIYGYSMAFKGYKSLIQHSSLDSNELSELNSQLQIRNTHNIN